MSTAYDKAFANDLAEKIVLAIMDTSRLADVTAVRPAETLEALANAMVMMLAMIPTMDDPTVLEEACQRLAKRLRRDVAKMRAEGAFDWLGGAKGSRA